MHQGANSSLLTQTAGVYLPVYPLRGCSLTAPLRLRARGDEQSEAQIPHVVVAGYGLCVHRGPI